MKSRFVKAIIIFGGIFCISFTTSFAEQLGPTVSNISRLHDALPEGMPDIFTYLQIIAQPFRQYYDLKIAGYFSERWVNENQVSYFSAVNPQQEFIQFKIVTQPSLDLVLSTAKGDPMHWQLALGELVSREALIQPQEWQPKRSFHFELPNPYNYKTYYWQISPSDFQFQSILQDSCRRSTMRFVVIGARLSVSECLKENRVFYRWVVDFEGNTSVKFEVQADDRSAFWQHQYMVEGQRISRGKFLTLFHQIVMSNFTFFANLQYDMISKRGQWPRR